MAGKQKRKTPEGGGTPAQPASTTPKLATKHRQTLTALFAKPERANIPWGDFVALMNAAGAVTTTAGGSAHGFTLRGLVLVVRRPHPGNHLPRPAVKRIRKFLTRVGITP